MMLNPEQRKNLSANLNAYAKVNNLENYQLARVIGMTTDRLNMLRDPDRFKKMTQAGISKVTRALGHPMGELISGLVPFDSKQPLPAHRSGNGRRHPQRRAVSVTPRPAPVVIEEPMTLSLGDGTSITFRASSRLARAIRAAIGEELS